MPSDARRRLRRLGFAQAAGRTGCAVGLCAARIRALTDELRALQAQRVPLPLIDGIGRNWGLWRINSIDENQSEVIDDGTAMVIKWVVGLTEFNNA